MNLVPVFKITLQSKGDAKLRTFSRVFIFTRRLWTVIYFFKYLEDSLAFVFR